MNLPRLLKLLWEKMAVKIDGFRNKWQNTTAIFATANTRESTVNLNPLMLRAMKTD